jgi:hypothetical protein
VARGAFASHLQTRLLAGLRIELSGVQPLKGPGTFEVMPPPPVGPDEKGAAPKSATARDVDDDLTLTQPVVPGLVGCKDCEGPAEQPSAGTASSVLADDF